MTSVGKGTSTYGYCSASYLNKREEVKFDQDTKRTFLHCSFCALTSIDKFICFLCKEHYDEFHPNWYTMTEIWDSGKK